VASLFGQVNAAGEITVLTDPEGRFEIPALADGRFSIFMSRPAADRVPSVRWSRRRPVSR
jgi:hypothetical protein